ncbi:MAG: hypothetical protein P8188_10125 [Gemmatimonadota bacterium]
MRVLRRAHLAALVVALLSGCAGGASAPRIVTPLPDPAAALREMEDRTVLEQPTRIFFDWTLTEEGIRVRGRGVARVQPPDRARLDLFLSNGEAVAGAILIGDELTLPVSLPSDILPPPELLWGTVGMIRLGSTTEVVQGGELEDGATLLQTRLPTQEGVLYRVRDGQVRMIEQTTGDGTVVKRLAAAYDGAAIPAEAVYRDLTAFRELTLTRDRVEHVEGFAPHIWRF